MGEGGGPLPHPWPERGGGAGGGGSQPTQPDFGYPYDSGDDREITDSQHLPAQAWLVHRGGSFKSRPEDLRATARGNALPDSKIAWRGFRVVMQIP